eukprot:8295688-Ditylum_brightwellii.AAC.1
MAEVSENVALYWDQTIVVDHVMEANCMCIIMLDRKKLTLFGDISLPLDMNLISKTAGKIQNTGI